MFTHDQIRWVSDCEGPAGASDTAGGELSHKCLDVFREYEEPLYYIIICYVIFVIINYGVLFDNVISVRSASLRNGATGIGRASSCGVLPCSDLSYVGTSRASGLICMRSMLCDVVWCGAGWCGQFSVSLRSAQLQFNLVVVVVVFTSQM